MKKSRLLLMLLCLLAGNLFGQSGHYPTPTSSFTANFCNFPLAWEASNGKAAPITIITEQLSKRDSTYLCRLVPNGKIRSVRPSHLAEDTKSTQGGITLLLEEPKPEAYVGLLKGIKQQLKQDNAVVLPAIFSEMDSTHCTKEWAQLLQEASAAGAIVVGAHGPSLVIGDLAFIHPLPIDVFSYVDIEEEGYPNARIRLKGNLERGAIPVAAALALRKGNEPQLTSQKLKDELRKYSSKAIWGDLRLQNGDEVFHFSIIKPNEKSFEAEIARHSEYNGKLEGKLYGSYFDAGKLVAHRSLMPNEWSYGILQVDSLRQLGTGKGVKVAILDHLFSSNDTSITKRYVTPGSAFPSLRYDEGNEGHGAWMARKLLDIAPEVSIIPVRITNEKYRSTCEGYVKGIDYALSQGANVISLSHQPVDSSEMAILDSAIARTSKQNACMVYIHYYGSRGDVVKTTPIEFADAKSNDKSINIIGTGFNGEKEFPFTWGFSQTAPMVAGVVALMKEKNPALSNEQVVRILRESHKTNKDGVNYLDAMKAVRSIK